MASKSGLGIRDIKRYFETAPMEVAEVAHEIVAGVMGDRVRKHATQVKALAKARASKGKGKGNVAATPRQPRVVVDEPEVAHASHA